MKRYALFVCEQEAANGGWADFRQAYDDLAVAQIAGMYWVEDMEDVSFAGLMDWHVVDLTLGMIVAQGNCESRPSEGDDNFDSGLDTEDEERSQR